MCLTPKMEVYKQSLSGEQERWRSQAGNKAQQFEQLSFIPSFKDGTPKRSKVLTATERLHVQNRLCRCVFNMHPDKVFISRFHVMCIHELPQNIEQKRDNYVCNFLQKPFT